MASKDNQLISMQKKMEELMRENEELKKRQYVPNEINFKINDHGAVSIQGLGKYPVQLFAEQVIRLLDKSDDLRKFIDDNKDNLSWRNKPRS
jgi:hypothetical protein